jgi:hypothetical protein
MSSFITKLFAGMGGKIFGKVADAVDSLHLSKEEKEEFKLKFEKMLMERGKELEITLRSQLQAKERILVAELSQGDNYTKRARPTVVYSGLVFILLNYCVFPLISHFTGQGIPKLDLPVEFWAGWSGIVMTWSIGRTFEKRGKNNKIVSAVTGTKQHSLLFEED